MKTVEDICKYIGSVITPHPNVVETGCTYVVHKENLVHTTSNNLYRHVVCPNSGLFFSLDVDSEHLHIVEELLLSIPNSEILFELLNGDSVVEMTFLAKRFKEGGLYVDVLCLDSKEFDEDHMVHEYNVIKDVLAHNHFVLVDDIHNPNSVKYKKMVPILKGLGYEYVEVGTPTGMLVCAKGYKF